MLGLQVDTMPAWLFLCWYLGSNDQPQVYPQSHSLILHVALYIDNIQCLFWGSMLSGCNVTVCLWISLFCIHVYTGLTPSLWTRHFTLLRPMLHDLGLIIASPTGSEKIQVVGMLCPAYSSQKMTLLAGVHPERICHITIGIAYYCIANVKK